MTNATPATHAHDTSREPLEIRSISVLRAPGITPGFTIDDLSPDITIIFGPNASGKSTTARAIQSVLWPHQNSLRGHHLAASFALDGDQWNIEASAGDVQRSRNGEPAEAPLIAPLDDRGRYSLGLPDLLASENNPLAQAIMNESSGGFDLPQIAESLGFDATIPPRLQSANDVQQAQTKLRDVLARENSTQESLAARGQLLSRREQSYAAARDIQSIEAALEYQRRLSDEAEAAEEVAGFPPSVRSFTGDEPGKIAELTNRINEQSGKIAEATRLRNRWRTAIDDTGIGTSQNPADQLKTLRQTHDQQAEIHTLITETEREVASAKSERTAHQNRLAADLNDEQIAAVDASGMREFADIAAAYESIRSRRTARDEVEMWLGGVKAPENLETLQQGVEILQSRLQHPNAAEQRQLTGVSRWIGIGAGALLAIAGAVLATSVDPLWWILAAVGVIVMILAWQFTSSNSPRIAAELEASYAEMSLPQPESWRGDNIRTVLGDLRNQLRDALVEQEKAERWKDLEQERAELDEAYAATESRREAAIGKYGIAPDLQEESLRLLADNLGRWQAADATVRGIEARRERLQHDLSTLQARSKTILSGLGFESGELSEQIDDLERRITSLDHAKSQLDAVQQEIDDTLQPRLDALVADRNSIYESFGLEPDDATGMHHLQQQQSQLVAAQSRLESRASAVRESWESLSLAPQWREKDVNTLLAARDEAQQIVDERPEIEAQIQELNRMEQAASHAIDRELALAELDGAKANLEKDRDRVLARSVGSLLLSSVQQETRDAALPIVFHRARELFAIITRGKYELQFESGPPPEFTALDTTTAMTLSLDQLSSGTRVQLLMAIRLGFVENVEVGPKLPVILDETLGNSDEFRASAIIDAAIDICRHGRQVFYFTAQGDEVARWLQRVEAMPEDERPQVKVVELTEIRRDAGFDRLPIPEATVATSPSLPSPADYDPETWAAAMRIPAIDPWATGMGGTHLWHVLADQDALYALLQEDITTLGQLTSLERTSPERLALIHQNIPDQLSEIHLRAELLDDAVHMWRIGRARPMPVGILAEAEMIDAVALEEMQTLQAQADNNGQLLLEQLQSMNDAPIAEKPLEALELWMISEGYIAQGAKMSDQDIRARIIELASPAIRSGQLDHADVDQIMTQMRSW